jgi:hypothetical protein
MELKLDVFGVAKRLVEKKEKKEKKRKRLVNNAIHSCKNFVVVKKRIFL